MNGPEHYREAERLLGFAFANPDLGAAETIAAAHVHALLAETARKVDQHGHYNQLWMDILDGEERT